MKKTLGIVNAVYFLIIILVVGSTIQSFQSFFDYIQQLFGPISGWEIISYLINFGIISGIGAGITMLDLHNKFDKIIFGVRDETDKKIRQKLEEEMRKFCTSKNVNVPENINYMDIFYHFVGKEDNAWNFNRNRAYEYWTKYFCVMNLILLSIFGVFIFDLSILLGNNVSSEFAISLILFFLFMIGVFSVLARYKMSNRLTVEIPKLQLDQIIFYHKNDLEQIFQQRINTKK